MVGISAQHHENAYAADIWLTSWAHRAYLVATGFFGGGDVAHLFVGHFVLILFVLLTMLSTRFVMLEGYSIIARVYDIGLKFLKVLFGVALVVFLAIWTVRIYQFVYPDLASREAAKAAATQAVDRGTVWMHWLWSQAGHKV